MLSAAGDSLPFRPGRAGPRGRWRRQARRKGGIELSITAVGQALPVLVLSQEGDAEEAPHGQVLTIGAEAHQGVPFLAIARIENGAVLIVQALPLHALDDGQAEPRRILLIAHALGTERIGRIAGLQEHFDDGALIDAIVLEDEEPRLGLAGFRIDLLPEPGGAGLLRIHRACAKAQARQSDDDEGCKMPSHSKIPAWSSPPVRSPNEPSSLLNMVISRSL